MKIIDSISDLEAIYGEQVPNAITKVLTELSPHYQQWIETSRFVILSTVGPEGTDASPRGDTGSVVRVVDPQTLWMPDWRGNNRIDSLRNIVRDNRVSLMFMVPGCNNVVRVNGLAQLTADSDVLNTFEKLKKHPRTVVVVNVKEVYFQCAKALMRSRLWQSEDESGLVPTAGQFIKGFNAEIDVDEYDASYGEYAKTKMW